MFSKYKGLASGNPASKSIMLVCVDCRTPSMVRRYALFTADKSLVSHTSQLYKTALMIALFYTVFFTEYGASLFLTIYAENLVMSLYLTSKWSFTWSHIRLLLTVVMYNHIHPYIRPRYCFQE